MKYLGGSFSVYPGSNKAYRDNYDAIFGKKNKEQEEKQEPTAPEVEQKAEAPKVEEKPKKSKSTKTKKKR